jgi:hypothetical protein
MKLRASYGTLGNDQILIMVMFLNFLVKLLMFFWYLTEQQTVKYIKFEVGTSAKFDLGLDLKLFNNKLSIVTDYFTDTRKFIDSKIPVSIIMICWELHLQLMLEQ